MPPNRTTCAPIYVKPEKMRIEAKEALRALRACSQWVDDSTLFLNKNGTFSHMGMEEASFKVRTQKASFFLAKLVSSPGYSATSEEQRLHIGGRQLLVSLLAHAWLWGRPKVLDNDGNPVAFEKRQVLAPQSILDFLAKIRARRKSCTYDELREFLETVPQVSLHEDRSGWNVTGVIACLRWDKSHDLQQGGPWCSCRYEKHNRPPPYHEICPTNSPNNGLVCHLRQWFFPGSAKEEKRGEYDEEMTKAMLSEIDEWN